MSLKTFNGDMTYQSSFFQAEICFKPTILEKNEEALLVDGCGEQGKNEVTINSTSTSIGNHKEVQLYGSDKASKRERRNPLGSNDRPLLCRSCGSYRHPVAKCPDSWENMYKMKA